MQIFKGVAFGKQSFREHCATKWLLEANPRNICASKISRYTVFKAGGGRNFSIQSFLNTVKVITFLVALLLVAQ